MMLYLLLLIQVYTYTMQEKNNSYVVKENETVFALTKKDAEYIKKEIDLQVKRENGKFHIIPKDVINFMIRYSDIYDAYVALRRPPEFPATMESNYKRFNDIVDSYTAQ